MIFESFVFISLFAFYFVAKFDFKGARREIKKARPASIVKLKKNGHEPIATATEIIAVSIVAAIAITNVFSMSILKDNKQAIIPANDQPNIWGTISLAFFDKPKLAIIMLNSTTMTA